MDKNGDKVTEDEFPVGADPNVSWDTDWFLQKGRGQWILYEGLRLTVSDGHERRPTANLYIAPLAMNTELLARVGFGATGQMPYAVTATYRRKLNLTVDELAPSRIYDAPSS